MKLPIALIALIAPITLGGLAPLGLAPELPLPVAPGSGLTPFLLVSDGAGPFSLHAKPSLQALLLSFLWPEA